MITTEFPSFFSFFARAANEKFSRLLELFVIDDDRTPSFTDQLAARTPVETLNKEEKKKESSPASRKRGDLIIYRWQLVFNERDLRPSSILAAFCSARLHTHAVEIFIIYNIYHR